MLLSLQLGHYVVGYFVMQPFVDFSPLRDVYIFLPFDGLAVCVAPPHFYL
jgi:hypothetical protein